MSRAVRLELDWADVILSTRRPSVYSKDDDESTRNVDVGILVAQRIGHSIPAPLLLPLLHHAILFSL